MKAHLASPDYPTTEERSHVEVTALSCRETELLLQEPAQTSWKQLQRIKMLVSQPGQLTAITTCSIRGYLFLIKMKRELAS